MLEKDADTNIQSLKLSINAPKKKCNDTKTQCVSVSDYNSLPCPLTISVCLGMSAPRLPLVQEDKVSSGEACGDL